MKEERDTRLRNRVRLLRNRLHLRQADLAGRVGVTRQTIIAIEKDRLTPSVAIALRLARELREPVDYVFYLERDDIDHAASADQPDTGHATAPPASAGEDGDALSARVRRAAADALAATAAPQAPSAPPATPAATPEPPAPAPAQAATDEEDREEASPPAEERREREKPASHPPHSGQEGEAFWDFT